MSGGLGFSESCGKPGGFCVGAGGLGSQLGRNFQPGAHLAGGEGRREVGEPEVGVLEGAQSQGPVNVARMRSWGSRHGFWYQWAWSGVVDMISCTDGRSLWAGGWPQWAWPGAGGRGLGQVGVAWGRGRGFRAGGHRLRALLSLSLPQGCQGRSQRRAWCAVARCRPPVPASAAARSAPPSCWEPPSCPSATGRAAARAPRDAKDRDQRDAPRPRGLQCVACFFGNLDIGEGPCRQSYFSEIVRSSPWYFFWRLGPHPLPVPAPHARPHPGPLALHPACHTTHPCPQTHTSLLSPQPAPLNPHPCAGQVRTGAPGVRAPPARPPSSGAPPSLLAGPGRLPSGPLFTH